MMTMLANRGNIVTEAIAFIFLMVQEDVVNPQYCTTEPCEHTFAGWRCERCEATVEECLSIEDKRSYKVNAIYGGKLAAHHDSRSGYQSTWSDFVKAGQGTNQYLPVGGPATVNLDGGPFVNELWPFVKP